METVCINQCITSGDIPTMRGWFLGDSGYSLRPNLLTPGRIYNCSFLKSRKTIECDSGYGKRSMHETGGTLNYTPGRVCRLVINYINIYIIATMALISSASLGIRGNVVDNISNQVQFLSLRWLRTLRKLQLIFQIRGGGRVGPGGAQVWI